MDKKLLDKYNDCPVRVIIGPFGKHYAKLVAITPKREVQLKWLSAQDAEELIKETEA